MVIISISVAFFVSVSLFLTYTHTPVVPPEKGLLSFYYCFDDRALLLYLFLSLSISFSLTHTHTTRFLAEKGFYSFHNCFDDRAW